MTPKSSMIQGISQCMDFDDPKVYGDTSIYDGLDVNKSLYFACLFHYRLQQIIRMCVFNVLFATS